ncbi:MAG: dienelactone hydrolase family protein [Calditrichota bacterium]
MKFLFVLLFLFGAKAPGNLPFKTISFPSADDLEISADLYLKYPHDAPFIILFHQAGYSRGEYRDIALKLNEIGFNALAVDLRSGNEVNNVVNETARQAAEKNLPTSYLDALPDMEAAIKYVKDKYASRQVIIWGSSYSAGLVLKIAGDNPGLVAGVIGFSPGEYFERSGKSSTFIQESAKHIQIPVFITSAKNEKDRWWLIYQVIPGKKKSYFLPQSDGIHGSRALWDSTPNHEEYWTAVKKFLRNFVETMPSVVPGESKKNRDVD